MKNEVREQRAEVTRRAILHAARRLFAERSYSHTGIRDIASEAGVAVQTIYAAFGSKPGIVVGLVDVLDREAGVREIAEQAMASEDPSEVLELLARMQRQIRDRCGDIVQIQLLAVRAEPHVPELREGLRRHAEGSQRTVQLVDRLGGLRPGLSREEAVAACHTLMSPDASFDLVERWGWTWDQYEEWLASALKWALLGRS